MQKESDINKDSLSAQWMLVKAGAQNAFSSLGETLRQPLMDIMDYVKSVTGGLRRWIENNPELAGTLAVAVAAVLGPIAVIRFGLSMLGVKTLPSVFTAVTRTGSALSWLANAPLSVLRRGMASAGGGASLLTAPLNALRRSAGVAGNALKTLAGAPLNLLRAGMAGIRNIVGMVM
ncbi:phage tail tape measure protein, partial [Salmonella enterica subsp. enterica serovar Cerro]|nr:phage tail tape measure protein [Salmonella enterica subsp. enterica serovar Cerro]